MRLSRNPKAACAASERQYIATGRDHALWCDIQTEKIRSRFLGDLKGWRDDCERPHQQQSITN